MLNVGNEHACNFDPQCLVACNTTTHEESLEMRLGTSQPIAMTTYSSGVHELLNASGVLTVCAPGHLLLV